ncbi:cation:proton antiporter [Taibaiella chishuiensis]|uniref:Transporter (CPA2 family) n=1 Tax=Taibaiella chishuiensis TaxID=1434707 RepID=A0A2P8D2K4_9BACT|nr:cation:proton antiporter [Taibaiella chishuiensis]PSK91441.1 transporter (CPA2 family) [Taibaiella chishuiensis]
MKSYKNILFYTVTIVLCSLLIYFILQQGLLLELTKPGAGPAVKGKIPSTWDQFIDTYSHNLHHPLAILLLQIVSIILVARFFGMLFNKIGQPAVIGEIIAGIFLGPSFLGHYFPEYATFLFPEKSLPNLQFLSQIGLILFMFVIGMELDLKILKNKAKDAVVISHASIIFPFALGIGLAYFIYRRFAPEGIHFLSFALFMGIAMSITAFPVLARIVQERGLSKTRLGTIAITCAAADDITAWCILAAVIAIVKAGSVLSALYTLVLAVVYVLLMLQVVKPFLQRLGDKYSSKESLSKPVVAIFFTTLLVSAYATEVIGIHALFGAFLAGVVMPSNMSFRNVFIEKVEDVAQVLLLPLFFVFTGLRTQIGLLNDPYLWQVCAIIVLLAVLGKFAGSALAARFVGQSWRDSLSIGVLMNTRGLVELIVLNIGYDLGVLSPEVFAMLVIMALLTTMMTGPGLDLINRLMPEPKAEPLADTKAIPYRILLSFGTPRNGTALLRIAYSLSRKNHAATEVTAMHLSPGNDLNQYNEEEYEKEAFEPLIAEADQLDMAMQTLFKPSVNRDEEIAAVANKGHYDLLLIGMGQPLFEGTLLGKILGFTSRIINPERWYKTLTGAEKLFPQDAFDDGTRYIAKAAGIPVGILVDKEPERLERIYIPVYDKSDVFLATYMQRLLDNPGLQLTLADPEGMLGPEALHTIQQTGNLSVARSYATDKAFFEEQDLVLISLDSWKHMIEKQEEWLGYHASILILKP